MTASIETLTEAIRAIVDANEDFRSGMGENWEGDPLQDAIDAAAKLLPPVKKEQAS